MTASTHWRAAQPSAPDQPIASSPLTKQFEETSYYLKDVDFISADVGWAVGHPHWDQARRVYTGTIIKTTDGGQTWNAQPADTLATLLNVDFVDANHGWTVGTDGVILHTADGGAHWMRQTVASTDEFRGVAFANTNQGWATSFHAVHFDSDGDPDDWRGSIWHTADGGAHWTRQTLPANASLLNRLDFIDAQRGWAVGVKFTGNDQYGQPQHAGVVYRTADGGQTWQELYSPGADIVLNGVAWIDAYHGWVVGFPTLSSMSGGFTFHTADGGQTWQRQAAGQFFTPLWDVAFVDANRGYIVGVGLAGPVVRRTLDGGATWQEIYMAQYEEEGLFGLAIVGDQVIAVGDYGYVARSTRAWDPFTPTPCINGVCLFTQAYLNTHYTFHDVFFANANDGWAVGSRSYLPNVWGQVIFYTANGGQTWASQYELAPPAGTTFSTLRLDSVQFLDALHGWAVGGLSQVIKTDDGGEHWTRAALSCGVYPCRANMFAVAFADDQHGWIVGEGAFRTSDGGAHWPHQDMPMRGWIQDVQFLDEGDGWLATTWGEMWFTVNGGERWRKLTGESGFALRGLHLLDRQHGWFVGDGGTILKLATERWPVQEEVLLPFLKR